MRCFPQLAQYPVRRRRCQRTVVNECMDGHRVKLADAAGGRTKWRLTFRDLTDDEAGVLRSFFEESEGRLGSFTFLDPVDNLLRWSEKLDEAVWERGPLLSVQSLDGHIWQVANAGGAAQTIVQWLSVPADYYYCLGVWTRGTGGVALLRGEERAAEAAGEEWRRMVFAAQSQTAGEMVRFGVELEPGAAVELFGMQVEAQMGASAYKKTSSRGGVYEGARFDQDELRMTTVGVGRHECELKVVHGARL